MPKGIVRTISENKTGRNTMFENTVNHSKMNRIDFVNKIESGKSIYSENYYVREINGVKTPVSKPDGIVKNNLG